MIVGKHKWVFSPGEGSGSIIGVVLEIFCNLAVNSGMRTGPIGGLSTRR